MNSTGPTSLGFGVKFTNTLIVRNHRDFFPESEKEMYLSGPPLHVLAMNLVQRFRGRFGDRFPISFSAGIDRKNFPDAVALGLVPVTVCSDLLKPGGYARSKGYFDELRLRMEAVGATSVDGFVRAAYGLASGSTSEAVLANTEHYVERLNADERYRQPHNAKPPRKIGSRLELFDCITCDKCVPVCPNDANFTFVLPQLQIPIVKVRRDGERWIHRTDGVLAIEEKHQIANFADFCNECGNCDVFCPEDGGPYVIKPRFFGSLADWGSFEHLDGFFCERAGDGDRIHGRFDGRELRVETSGGEVRYVGDGFDVRFEEDDPLGTLRGEATVEVDLAYFRILTWIRDAVMRSEATSYPRSLLEA